MIRLILGLCLLTFSSNALRAQWQSVGPTVAHPTYGAVQYKNGTVWVGGQELYSSADSGASWQRVPFPDPNGITDICFLNADTGVVATLSDLYQTFDRGATWKGIARDKWQYMRAAYVFSASNIAAMASNNLYLSRDGGKSWTTRPAGKYGLTFGLDRYGALFFPDAMTSDLGKSWSPLVGFPASSTDAWSMVIDSCDSRKMVVAVDNYFTSADGLCRIVNSSDGGMTWSVAAWWKKPNLSGALVGGPHTMYAGCLDRLLRSSDAGVTWNSMPGSPSTGPDSRSIAAVDDNLLFVLDVNGTIWKTVNSGGDSLRMPVDPVPAHAVSPKSLFGTDTLLACSTDSVVSFVHLSSSGCAATTLSSVEIIGAESTSYSASVQMPLVARVVFHPKATGAQIARLLLHLTSGQTDTVLLDGSAFAAKKFAVVMSDVQEDTLGAIAEVPITFSGVPDGSRLESVLRYAPMLEYLGTYATDGTKLDISGQQWDGASRISVIAYAGKVVGYARFRIYNDSNADLRITIDSLELPEIADAPCEYVGIAATSRIMAPANCGAEITSRYLHSGARPRFSIYPNPASNGINLVSDANIQDATIEIFDMLGNKQFEEHASIESNVSKQLRKCLPSGVYNVTIRVARALSRLRVIVRE